MYISNVKCACSISQIDNYMYIYIFRNRQYLCHLCEIIYSYQALPQYTVYCTITGYNWIPGTDKQDACMYVYMVTEVCDVTRVSIKRLSQQFIETLKIHRDLRFIRTHSINILTMTSNAYISWAPVDHLS